ncbi:MAG TPA: tandem-95 repeat protein [Chryseosolibacter sp.]|nr:tandem-95 repeat protein [Chryseosolibacter sp.]
MSQYPVSTPEETPRLITLSDLIIEFEDDEDDEDEDDHELILQVDGGSNYYVDGQIITPITDYNGDLSIPVRVYSGDEVSNTYNLAVTVSPLNDPPMIVGQTSLQTNEDAAIELSLSHLTVTDPDNSYPDDFTIAVYSGTNYTNSGSFITPALNYYGLIEVPVTVNDGASTSNTFNVQISVSSVNDAPVIIGQSASLVIGENESVTIVPEHLNVSDVDNTYPSGFSLIVYEGSNYTVSGNTVTPIPNYNGSLLIPVSVNDGLSTSSPFNMTATVNQVNSEPVITGQVPLQTNEETGMTLELAHFTVSDNDNTYPDGFTLTVSEGANYTVTGNTITPVVNYNGVLSVPVTVNDGQNTSAPFNAQITVAAANDPPVITGQNALNTPEDTPITIALTDVQVSDPDNTYPDGFTMQISSGENYTVSGTTIAPTTNFTGTLSVPVTVNDGQAPSQSFVLQIGVSDVNDAPVITGQNEVATNEDIPVTITLSHLIVTDPGNPELTGVTVSVQAGTNYTVSGRTVTPDRNFSGTLTVPVSVSDGTNTSGIFNLSVTVNPVNDAPVINGQAVLNTYRNSSVIIEFSHLSVTDVDNVYPTGFLMSVMNGANYTVAGQSITPAADFVGTLSVQLQVSDGLASSQVFNFRVDVVPPPNVAPIIESHVTLGTYQNQAILLQLAHFQVTDPDNRYPDDFTLHVQDGENYSLNGHNVVPANNYSGTLTVPVRVRDQQSYSEWFNAAIQVIPVSQAPLITRQNFLRINEDDSLQLTFGDITVVDTDDDYPVGFSMAIGGGENYSVKDNYIVPNINYSGYLTVPVTVNDGTNTSPSYSLLVLVDAINDAPHVSLEGDSVVLYSVTSSQVPVFQNFLVNDVDNDTLTLAEIVFTEGYAGNVDTLICQVREDIRAVFDPDNRTLVLFGRSSVSAYQEFVRSIVYEFKGDPQVTPATRRLSVSVNDGQLRSNNVELKINFSSHEISLDIPTGFTPNGDGVNDTWTIVGGETVLADGVTIRIFNKRGIVVFETHSYVNEWDGRMNGVLLPADTYYYTVDVDNDLGKKRYKGVITLLR